MRLSARSPFLLGPFWPKLCPNVVRSWRAAWKLYPLWILARLATRSAPTDSTDTGSRPAGFGRSPGAPTGGVLPRPRQPPRGHRPRAVHDEGGLADPHL